MTAPANRRRYWARQLIERQTPNRPTYGSTEWLMLANEHPDKIAACVIAAECWATASDTLEEDLRREIEGLQIGLKRAEDAEYQRGFAEKVKRNGGRILTSFEERRRLQIEAAKPRDDDRRGDGQVSRSTLAPAPPGKWDSRFWGGDAG